MPTAPSLTAKVQTIGGSAKLFARRLMPPSEEVAQARGELWAALELNLPAEVDGNLAIKIFFDSLSESYFSSNQESCLTALEQAMLEARERLVGLVTTPEALSFNLTTAALWGDVLYLGQVGAAVAYLFREGSFEDIGVVGVGLRVASGRVQKDDTVILGNASFGQQWPPSRLAASFNQLEEATRGARWVCWPESR